VGLFRPERVVTGHDGREWEIYLSRFESPGWKPHLRTSSSRRGLLLAPVALVRELVWPAMRFVALLPWALIQARRSKRIHIDAVTFYPWPESQRWLTTTEHLDEVMVEVVRGLRIGELARPDEAHFRGSRQLVGGTFRVLGGGD
jgi:hypothetical protein